MRHLALLVPLLLILALPALATPTASASRGHPLVAAVQSMYAAPTLTGAEALAAEFVDTPSITRRDLAGTITDTNRLAPADFQRLRARGPSLDRREAQTTHRAGLNPSRAGRSATAPEGPERGLCGAAAFTRTHVGT